MVFEDPPIRNDQRGLRYIPLLRSALQAENKQPESWDRGWRKEIAPKNKIGKSLWGNTFKLGVWVQAETRGRQYFGHKQRRRSTWRPIYYTTVACLTCDDWRLYLLLLALGGTGRQCGQLAFRGEAIPVPEVTVSSSTRCAGGHACILYEMFCFVFYFNAILRLSSESRDFLFQYHTSEFYFPPTHTTEEYLHLSWKQIFDLFVVRISFYHINRISMFWTF